MTFQPALPLPGYAGWTFLKRTMPAQTEALQASPEMKRDEAYFREKIGSINSAEDLVKDRRLLKITLGAYGLDADINNRFFIRKVLESETLKGDSLANRLADKQYLKLADAFGFGDFSTPRNKLSDFADKTLALYRTRQFESAVGQQNGGYRLALNAEREIASLAAKSSSSDTKWFTIMGNTPLRKVFETALRLPSSIGTIDIDRQLKVFKSRAEAQFGSSDLAQFKDPKKLDALVRSFLLASEQANTSGSMQPAARALQMLQASSSLFARL
jgi:Protein of unknown function (DUF1217)